MRDISERIIYLQGLSEGLNISDNSPQGKIITGILGVMHNIYEEINYLRDELNVYKEYTESLDDSYAELEKMLGLSTEQIRKIDVACSSCGEKISFDLALSDEDVIEIICPECNEIIYINDSAYDHEFFGVSEIQAGDTNNYQQHL